MYDSVYLWIGIEEVAGGDALACLTYLDDVTEHQRGSQFYYSGWIRNYKVNVSDTGISLKGSLAKFHLDDNIKTLNRGDTERAIEKLSDEIHLPVKSAKVTRMDSAQNMLMRYEPEAYYKYLGDCQYYQRLIQPQAVYYNNSQRVKLFYNKVAEAKKKRVSIPEVVNGQNLLRFELRFTSRLSKQFKNEVRAFHLSDERFYIELVNRWILEYQNIQKHKLININHNDMNSPKDFWKQGNLHWIKLIGQDTAMRMVDDMRARQVFEKAEYYSRLKKEIRELCSQPDVTETSELIAELDNKISRVKMYYR
jgi:hypothetical protein